MADIIHKFRQFLFVPGFFHQAAKIGELFDFFGVLVFGIAGDHKNLTV